MDINEVIAEYCLYDEYVICKEGWEQVSLEQTDVDMGKSITYWEIILHHSIDDTHWICEFGNSYYNGVRDGYKLSRYYPELEEKEMVDLDELGSGIYEYVIQLRYYVKELLDDIEDSTFIINDGFDLRGVYIDDIEFEINRVKNILTNFKQQ